MRKRSDRDPRSRMCEERTEPGTNPTGLVQYEVTCLLRSVVVKRMKRAVGLVPGSVLNCSGARW